MSVISYSIFKYSNKTFWILFFLNPKSISELLFGKLLAPIGRVNSAATPVPFSPPLEDAYLPSVAKIVNKCKVVISAV